MSTIFPDDSDSDDEYLKKKRNRGTRGVRGFSKKQSQTSEEVEARAAVYSTAVSKCLSNFQQSKTSDLGLVVPDDTADSDVEDDIGNLNKKSKCKSSRYSPVLLLSDCEEDGDERTDMLITPEKCENIDCNVVKSPSPPPPPPEHWGASKKSRRRNKQIKTALKNLTDVQDQLTGRGHQVSESPDPDIYIISDKSDEVTVRIDLMGEIRRFNVKVYQPFSVIISAIAAMEGVTDTMIMLVHKDRTVQDYDTPSSLKLHTADIIKCHIGENLNDSLGLYDSNVIQLSCQSKNARQKVSIKAHMLRPLSVLMKDYATKVKAELSTLQFRFDGELLQGSETPDSLDMEDGDCIDVISLR